MRLLVWLTTLVAAAFLVQFSTACRTGSGPTNLEGTCPSAFGDFASYGCVSVTGVLTRTDGTPVASVDVSGNMPVGSPSRPLRFVQGATTDPNGRFSIVWVFFVSAEHAAGDSIAIRLLANDAHFATGPFDSILVTRVFALPRTPLALDTLRWVTSSAP